MARQTGEIKITGTIDGICFYKMHDRYYIRMKSSLTGKRFRNDKVFEGSRRSAERFALGNRIASGVYRMVDEEKRVYPLFCFLKKKAIALAKEGEGEKVIKRMLIKLLKDLDLMGKEKKVGREKKIGTETMKFTPEQQSYFGHLIFENIDEKFPVTFAGP